MPNYNKVILMGNLCAKPELRYLQSGKPMAKFSVAVNERYKSEKGEEVERVCFVDVASFGRQAEVVAQYLDKGSPVLVDGRLSQDKWEDKEGKKRSKIEVILNRFQFLSSRKGAHPAPGGFDEAAA